MPDVRLASPQGKWIVLTTVLGSAMALLDSTVVNVALPRIGLDLGADLAALQWTVNAYMLTLAGLILLGGSLGDRYGRRKVFVIGVLWFAAASLLCGIAPNAGFLIAARALQGVGGALLTPGSLALIQASFHPDDRGRAVGLWSGFGGVGAAVGPFVGGGGLAGGGGGRRHRLRGRREAAPRPDDAARHLRVPPVQRGQPRHPVRVRGPRRLL